MVEHELFHFRQCPTIASTGREPAHANVIEVDIIPGPPTYHAHPVAIERAEAALAQVRSQQVQLWPFRKLERIGIAKDFRAVELSEYKLYSWTENWAFLGGTSLAKPLFSKDFCDKADQS